MSPSLYIEFRSTNAVLRRGTAMEEKAMPSVWSTKPWVGDAVGCPKHSKKTARKNTNGKSEKKAQHKAPMAMKNGHFWRDCFII